MIRTAAATAVLALLSTPALAIGPQSYDAKRVEVEGLLGTLTVTVDPAVSQVTLAVTGPQEWLDQVEVRMEGDKLVVDQEDRPRRSRFDEREDWLDVKLTVPVGTPLTVEDYIGEGTIGDLNGPLDIDDMNAGRLTVGNVTTLHVGVEGSGNVEVGTSDVAEIDVAGSGDVRIGDVAGTLNVDIAGSGSVTTGSTVGKVDVDVAGSGDVTVASVNGPVDIDIAGSGNVNIKAGSADPLDVSIAGSGDVEMTGEVRNQTIDQSGSGKVRIRNAAR